MGEVTGKAWIDHSEPRIMAADLEAIEAGIVDAQKAAGTGGQYVDDEGEMRPFIFVASDTDPGASRVIDGVTYEVWWVQTEPPPPPDPTQWVPAPVTQNLAGRAYTVPLDDGATYTIDGAAKAAGTYAVSPDVATTLEWAAVAKPGYTFKAGAATSGSMVWPEKEWVSGDVLMSDSFNRPDGPLIGSMSDSFEGGTPRPWTAPGQFSDGAIESGAITPTGTFFTPDVHVYSTPQDNIRLEWAYATVPGVYGGFSLHTSAGSITVQRTTVYHPGSQGAAGGQNAWYTPHLAVPNAGDRLAVYSTTTPEGWRKWTLENLTTGAKVSGVNDPGGPVLPSDGGVLDDTGLKITKITWGGRGDDNPVGALDLVVVKIP